MIVDEALTRNRDFLDRNSRETRETFKHMIVENESLRNVSLPHRLAKAQQIDKRASHASKFGRVSVLCAG